MSGGMPPDLPRKFSTGFVAPMLSWLLRPSSYDIYLFTFIIIIIIYLFIYTRKIKPV